ncbi:hypothetical protein BKA64DRAFT_647765 [Cadophora sp. MPI-SDFR-AT-0126]|nr:hypothetical protein BKA64DRAFT_647765 [Leotiomycetes sp. MPI-SDFR-AT-0126]
MEPSFNFPQDDYALAVLTHAAIHTHASAVTTTPSSTSISRSTSQAQTPRPDRTSASTTSPPFNIQSSLRSTTVITQRPTRDINQPNAHLSQPRPPDILSGYGHRDPDHTNTDMETLTYNPAQQSHSFMNGVYSHHGNRLGGSIPTSQSHMSSNYSGTLGNLGILNAESYDDGRLAMSLGEKRQNGRTDQVIPFGVTEASGESHDEEGEKSGKRTSRRKRTATEQASSKEIDDEEEARKKARGRPRVDTKDETAADRRRTQIRMAQRAYRHRKETTISSLEKQVQDLRGTNEEMSNIFISLYDFAVGKGLLQREPEFGQQLQSTTERFLALAKATVNEDSHEEVHGDDGKQADSEPGRRAKGSKASPKKRQDALAEPHVTDPVNPWGGYTMSKDDTPPDDDLAMEFPQYESRGRHSGLEVITRPTEDNASFPFDLMDLQQYRVEVPPIQNFSENFIPDLQPPLPSTHAYNEFSLARRISRAAIERAFRLVTSKSVDPEVFNRAFGLTLMYETRESLEARLRLAILKTNKDALSQWKSPFVHIGGSGTFYPDTDPTNDDLRPKLRTGFSIGPFSPAATEAQDLFVEEMRCNVPGYEGQFFDSNDVEGYLRGRGLDIPASADFITAELDVSVFTEAGTPKSSSSLDTSSPKTPESPRQQRLAGPSFASHTFDFTNPEPKDFPFPQLKYGNWNSQGNVTNANIDPIFNTLPDGGSGVRRQSPESTDGEVPFTERRLVTINVQTLINEILEKGVCLGRAPGFRPSDVNAAIVAAVKAGFD